MKLSDRQIEIVEKCIDGNDCEEFFLEYESLIRYGVLKILKMYGLYHFIQDAEDIVHEFFEKLLDDDRCLLKRFDFCLGTNFNCWLTVVATNFTRQWLRGKGVNSAYRSKRKIPLDECQGLEFDPGVDTDEVLSLEKLKKHLEPRDKLILTLRVRGFSSAEIASKMNLTEGSVNNRVSKIRKKLREHYCGDLEIALHEKKGS